MRTNQFLIASVALLVILLVVAPAAAQVPLEKFESIFVNHAATLNGAVTAGSTLSVAGATTFAANITQSDGNVTVADWLIVAKQTSITVTNGGVLTPTGTYQPITAAGAVTITMGACGVAGRQVNIINTTAQNIIVQDTGNAKLSSAATLNQYDPLALWCDGTYWIQISAESDN
jgi:hypothetical protein